MKAQDYLKIVGNNIQRLRGKLSQDRLAKKAGVSRSTIQNIEKGKNIELEHIINIAIALDINPADLFLTEDERHEVSYKAKLFWDTMKLK